MAKKASKSPQAVPAETASGVEYQYVSADDPMQLLMQVNAMAERGWRVVTIVDRPGVCRAWMRRER